MWSAGDLSPLSGLADLSANQGASSARLPRNVCSDRLDSDKSPRQKRRQVSALQRHSERVPGNP